VGSLDPSMVVAPFADTKSTGHWLHDEPIQRLSDLWSGSSSIGQAVVFTRVGF
jgi:hypothetical protein